MEIDDRTVAVSLISKNDHHFQLSAVGTPLQFSSPEITDIVAAVDRSLSTTAESAGISSNDEPSDLALILPPHWVTTEGKIIPEKLKVFDTILRELKLQAAGFIAFDDALVEVVNLKEGFPASFILVAFSGPLMTVSLVYLGKVVERVYQKLDQSFHPKNLEAALLEFQSESTLPPEIVIIGQFTDNQVAEIRDYSWIGKKGIETFLHHPDVKYYQHDDLAAIYFKAIISQFSTVADLPTPEPEIVITPDQIPEEATVDVEETSPEDLGFSKVNLRSDDFSTLISPDFEVIAPPPVEEPPPLVETVEKTAKFTAPKIKLPQLKIKLPRPKILFTLLGLAPLLVVPYFLLYRITLTLNITPIPFNQTIAIDLPVGTGVQKETIPISVSGEVVTTGQLTTGERAKGEIVIFNKTDKLIIIPSGSILTDASGKKFQTTNRIEVVASSQDLNQGVITMGQTKGFIEAADIGEEFNLAKDTLLALKDFNSTVAMARITTGLSGGSKRQVPAIAAGDRTSLDKKLRDSLTDSIDKKIQELSRSQHRIIAGSVSSRLNKPEFNREVGEEADKLTGELAGTITYFHLTPEQQISLLKQTLSPENQADQVLLDQGQFQYTIAAVKKSDSSLSGQLTISGQAPMKIDSAALVRDISGKTETRAISLIKKNNDRVYNYQIKTSLPMIFSLLPLNPANITIKNLP